MNHLKTNGLTGSNPVLTTKIEKLDMIVFQIIGIATTCIFGIYLLWRFFGPCTADHDTMARQGAEKCSECGEEL
jgi:hypothetical protein